MTLNDGWPRGTRLLALVFDAGVKAVDNTTVLASFGGSL